MLILVLRWTPWRPLNKAKVIKYDTLVVFKRPIVMQRLKMKNHEDTLSEKLKSNRSAKFLLIIENKMSQLSPKHKMKKKKKKKGTLCMSQSSPCTYMQTINRFNKTRNTGFHSRHCFSV